MRILIVTQFLFPDSVGGAGRYIHELAAGLQARAHAVTIITPQSGGQPSEDTRADGVRVCRCPPLQYWWQVPGSWLAIRRLFHQFHRLAPFDMIVIQQALPAFPLVWDRAAARLPWVYHFQSPWAQESAMRRSPRGWDPGRSLGVWVRWAIEHRVLRQADCRITLSESMKRILLDTHHVPAASVQVIPAWVALSRFQPAERSSARARVGVPQDATVLLTVRGLVPRQNLDNLIRAMPLIAKQHEDLQLYIGGAGPLEQSLRALIASLGLESRVHLLGVIPDEMLPQWYQAADLFIMPSKALEGFGLATLEALACGTPAIGTPIGGTKELLEQLDPTLLCAGIDPEAIASSILQTLPRLKDPRARQQLSDRCRAFALQFSRNTAIERIEQVYRRSARVRVLHVHTLPVISGSGLNTWLTMRGQHEAGYAAELACAPASTSGEYHGEDLAQLIEQAGMRFHPIRHLRRSMSPWHDVGALIELWRLCRRRRYALVHTHNSKAGVLGRLAARLAGVPVVIHTHHSCVFRYRHLRPWQRGLFLWVERLLAPLTTSFIAISETLRNDLVAARAAPPDRTVVIYSGVEIERFRQPGVEGDREALGVSRQDLVIGSIARLDVGKGHHELFESTAQLAREFPRLKVVCVGEGPFRSRLEEEIRRLHLEGRVMLLGERDDIPRLIQAFDIVVLASHYEGMGRVLLEAQAAGKPVVAAKAGGMIDVVRDGESGYLVPVGDATALAAAIGRLLADESLRKAMGERAARWVDARFSSRRMCEQIHALYDQLLTRCSTP